MPTNIQYETHANRFREFRFIEVSPAQLLLDPRNPRITVDSDDYISIKDKDLASDDVQRDVFAKINKKEYHIADLVRKIKEAGFRNDLGDFIVKNVKGTGKYLVLEGNRRTTAVRYLLTDPRDLQKDVLKSLQRFRVKEFIYKPNDAFTEEQVIDRMLAEIHVDGPLPWGAMEIAYQIYKSYLREYNAFYRVNSSAFVYHASTISKVARLYGFSDKIIEKAIMAYRIYEQLKHAGFSVVKDRFSIIDEALADSTLRSDYFDFDDTRYCLTENGLEKFYNLCVGRDKIVHNPQDLRKFKKVVKSGHDDVVNAVENYTMTLDEAVEEIKAIEKESKTLKQLSDIAKKLKSLNLASFENDKDECLNAANQIIYLVDVKLKRLIGKK